MVTHWTDKSGRVFRFIQRMVEKCKVIIHRAKSKGSLLSSSKYFDTVQRDAINRDEIILCLKNYANEQEEIFSFVLILFLSNN